MFPYKSLLLFQVRKEKIEEMVGGKKFPAFDNSVEWNTG
jgi:hypothetical protein